jgi:uncharacterized protein YjiS (DUF1127 family)
MVVSAFASGPHLLALAKSQPPTLAKEDLIVMLQTQRAAPRAVVADCRRHEYRSLPQQFNSSPLPIAVTWPVARRRSSAMIVLRHMAAVIRSWRQRARSREELARLSDHMLKDIGLSRSDALREAAKPFFRP